MATKKKTDKPFAVKSVTVLEGGEFKIELWTEGNQLSISLQDTKDPETPKVTATLTGAEPKQFQAALRPLVTAQSKEFAK